MTIVDARIGVPIFNIEDILGYCTMVSEYGHTQASVGVNKN